MAPINIISENIGSRIPLYTRERSFSKLKLIKNNN